MIYNDLKDYYSGGINNKNMHGIWFNVCTMCWVKPSGVSIQEYKIERYVNERFSYLRLKAGFFDFDDVCLWFVDVMTNVELSMLSAVVRPSLITNSLIWPDLVRSKSLACLSSFCRVSALIDIVTFNCIAPILRTVKPSSHKKAPHFYEALIPCFALNYFMLIDK